MIVHEAVGNHSWRKLHLGGGETQVHQSGRAGERFGLALTATSRERTR